MELKILISDFKILDYEVRRATEYIFIHLRVIFFEFKQFWSSLSFKYKPFHFSNQKLCSLCGAQTHRKDYQMILYLPFIN